MKTWKRASENLTSHTVKVEAKSLKLIENLIVKGIHTDSLLKPNRRHIRFEQIVSWRCSIENTILLFIVQGAILSRTAI
jgi:hypothetical protein